MSRYKIFVLLTAILLLAAVILPSSVRAKEITFEASLDGNIISLGQSTQLNLTFEGARDIPEPKLSGLKGFQARYMGPSTRMSIVNGRMSSSITHIYSLVPLKTGKFTIGPFSLEYEGETYVSNQLTIEVTDTSRPGSEPGRREKETALKDRIFLEMQTTKSRMYINEIIPLSIKLYINNLGIQDIQYPAFTHDGFSGGDFSKPLQYKENKGGALYDVIEFKTTLFGTKAGEFTLGPANLHANLVMKKRSQGHSSRFDDFFGAYSAEPIELKSEDLKVSVLPMPSDNRPPGFLGAVGKFRFDLEVSPKTVKAGDPLTIKMTITGEGNFSTVTSPVLLSDENFKTYEPQSKQNENQKIFEQILIPTTDSVKEIPSFIFSYFDTSSGKYQTISKGPVSITVTKPDNKEEITVLESHRDEGGQIIKENFGRDIIYIKDSPGKFRNKGDNLYNNPVFLIVQAIPFILLVSLFFINKKRKRLTSDLGYARRMKAPKKAQKGIREAGQLLQKNNTQEFYDTVFQTLREYIGDRFHISSGGITADIVENTLRDKDMDKTILGKLTNIFRECDMARYAPGELSAEKMAITLSNLKETIDYLERVKI